MPNFILYKGNDPNSYTVYLGYGGSWPPGYKKPAIRPEITPEAKSSVDSWWSGVKNKPKGVTGLTIGWGGGSPSVVYGRKSYNGGAQYESILAKANSFDSTNSNGPSLVALKKPGTPEPIDYGSGTPIFPQITSLAAAGLARGILNGLNAFSSFMTQAEETVLTAMMNMPGWSGLVASALWPTHSSLRDLQHRLNEKVRGLIPPNVTQPPPTSDYTPGVIWVIALSGQTLPAPVNQASSNAVYNVELNSSSSSGASSSSTSSAEVFLSMDNSQILDQLEGIRRAIQDLINPTDPNKGADFLQNFADVLDVAGSLLRLGNGLGNFIRDALQNTTNLAQTVTDLFTALSPIIEQMLDGLTQIDLPEREKSEMSGTLIVKPSDDVSFVDLLTNAQGENLVTVTGGMLYTPSYYEQGAEFL